MVALIVLILFLILCAVAPEVIAALVLGGSLLVGLLVLATFCH